MITKLMPVPLDMSVDRRDVNAIIARVNELIDDLAPPPPPTLSPDMPQAHIRGLGTVRPCRVCGALVAGGPTACGRCAVDLVAERDRLRAVLTEVRSWRRSAVGLEPRPATDAETLGERIDAALGVGP